MLASISAYGRAGEVTNVDSSRLTPSNDNAAWIGGVARFKGISPGGCVDDSAQKQWLASVVAEETSRAGRSMEDDGVETSGEEDSSMFLTDLLRLPLRSFLFLRPSRVL
jgi:hypothetical protein